MQKYILFGAGIYGEMALEDYGPENVAYFADNNTTKQGQLIHGKKVLSLAELEKIAKDYQIVISVNNARPIAEQLKAHGIFNYEPYSPVYQNLSGYFSEALKGKDIHGIALYGADRHMRQMIPLLRKIGLGHLLKCLAAPEGRRIIGQNIEGYTICTLQEIPPEVDCYIVAVPWNHAALRVSLQQHVKEKLVLDPFRQRAYYDIDEIVFEQSPKENHTEEEWHQMVERDGNREASRAYVETVKERPPLFEFVEIETINRCNGVCSFCPVNKKIDPRPETLMDRELFERIIGQLETLDYSGELALFSNNEPFLDERIIDLHKYARAHLPKARMHMFTNGTLLTVPKFVELMQYLDELIIDNYQQDLRLIKPSQEIKAYVEAHPELRKKVTIVLRKPNEVLTSRGGDAPNRRNLVSYGEETCALPFQQLIIRPDGKVSLCCNDPLGKCTLGDLTKQSILNVWYGPQFQMVRKCLAEGRKNWKHCEFCDTFYVY